MNNLFATDVMKRKAQEVLEELVELGIDTTGENYIDKVFYLLDVIEDDTIDMWDAMSYRMGQAEQQTGDEFIVATIMAKVALMDNNKDAKVSYKEWR